MKGPRDPDVASALTTVAAAMESQGDLAGAEALYRESLGLRRELLVRSTPKPSVPSTRSRTSSAPGERPGKPRLSAARRSRCAGGPPDSHPMVAGVLQVLGLSLVEQGRAAKASRSCARAWTCGAGRCRAGHWLIASSEGVLGDCLAKRGRFAEAEALLLRSLEQLAGSMGEDHERAVEARRELVALYETWGKPSKADRFRARAAAATP